LRSEGPPVINILSINCSLAFAPYLIDAMSDLEVRPSAPSRTIRQGGSGMVLGLGDYLSVIHRNRRADLDNDVTGHYLATIGLRAKTYEVSLMSDEVVLASVNESLFVSHPQSEVWLGPQAVRQLVASYRSGESHPHPALPDWLACSVAAGRLLLSDQRTGRWVLLGADHIAEFERRLSLLGPSAESPVPAPPVIQMKGVEIHLQSAFRLARTLRDFAQTRQVCAYEESLPEFKLAVASAVEGIQISDTNSRVGMTAREALKWAGIVEAELTRLNASEIVRGKITTVVADGLGGRFVLQWGDEVFVPSRFPSHASVSGDRLIGATDRGFSLLLDRTKSACVALTREEMFLTGCCT
jgi:hypothetical protein